jgi:hypothetical protein
MGDKSELQTDNVAVPFPTITCICISFAFSLLYTSRCLDTTHNESVQCLNCKTQRIFPTSIIPPSHPCTFQPAAGTQHNPIAKGKEPAFGSFIVFTYFLVI